MSVAAEAGPGAQVADFAERFASTWARPTADGLAALLHPQVSLVQPLLPRLQGREQARGSFARLLAAVTDLRGEVHAFGGTPERMFIEFTLRGAVNGVPLSWRAVDTFTLEDGLARERINYFDPLPALGQVLRRPAGWRGLLALMWRGRR